jgi:hypothetical protein
MATERPTELDLLNAFVGRWLWEGGGWYLVTRESGTMEGFGESRTLTVWSYDARAKLFRTAYVDSSGVTMIGTGRYDAASNTWRLHATSRDAAGKTSAKGAVRFPDPDTMEWDWTERRIGGLRKTMELTGVCRRER